MSKTIDKSINEKLKQSPAITNIAIHHKLYTTARVIYSLTMIPSNMLLADLRIASALQAEGI